MTIGESRLRRIQFSAKAARVRGEDPNPFERIKRTRYQGSPFRVCFHTAGLTALSAEQSLILGEICAPYRRSAIELAAPTPGDPPAIWNAPTPFQIERWNEDTGDVYATSGESKLFARFPTPGRAWSSEAVRRLSLMPEQRAQAIQVLIADAIAEGDLIITADQQLLSLRDLHPFRSLPLASPHEAFPILGAWSRAIDESYLAGWLKISDWYPHVLAYAVLKESWADFAVLAEAAAISSDAAISDMAGSIQFRLGQSIDALERLTVKWLCRSHGGGLSELDQVVLGVSAIQDNLALLAMEFLGVSSGMLRPHERSFRVEKWRRVIASRGEQGKHLCDDIEEAMPWLRVSEELRHHAVHRNVLGRVRYERDGVRSDGIILPPPLANTIKRVLGELHQPPSSWGLTPTRLQGDETEYLDPLPFAARLVAGTAHLINRVVRRLDPSRDARYPEEVRKAAVSGESRFMKDEMFGAENCRVAILCGPLSGLV